MKIKILKEVTSCFDEEEYTVDLYRPGNPHMPGDLTCHIDPFFPCPCA